MIDLISMPLVYLMEACYNLVKNYAVAIVLFTLLTKIILFPVSIWTQRNSIKMVEIMPAINELKIKFFGDKETIAEETQKLYHRVHYRPLVSSIPMIIQVLLLMGVISAVKTMLGSDTSSDFNLVPTQTGGWTLIMPLCAGLSSLCLGLAQNKISPLQREQSRKEQIATNTVSICISLFLGLFVPVGTCVYWISSNLLSIINQLMLNCVVPSEKYVDYKALKESQKKLKEYDSLSAGVSKEDKRREKEDYKRFFSVVNKHLVFYSESSGFYKYFKGIIEYLLNHSSITIHYVTSDPKDQIFTIAETQPRIRPYFIGEKKLITLFMKMDADVVVMTMSDLDNFHLKRSYVRKDIEYVYVQHGMGSINLAMRKGSEDHYDTVFCCGPHQKQELALSEEIFGTEKKKLIEQGYCLLDEMMATYNSQEHQANEITKILIAPSWQKDNIVDSCLETIIDGLCTENYQITIRPHPQEVRQKEQYMLHLKERYSQHSNVEVQTDFSSNDTVMEADLLITDWSGIAWEYAYTTKHPVLFINTPMKAMNPDYKMIPIEPMHITLRNEIGKDLELENLGEIASVVAKMLEQKDEYRTAIEKSLNERLYNPGRSAEVGGQYILEAVLRKVNSRKTG